MIADALELVEVVDRFAPATDGHRTEQLEGLGIAALQVGSAVRHPEIGRAAQIPQPSPE